MFRNFLDEDPSTRQFQSYLLLTRLYSYARLQKQIAQAYEPYSYLLSDYEEKTNRHVKCITLNYLDENSELTRQNVALLKNALQLWNDANNTSDEVAPIIYHYSIHCFISFFVYTFFRWEPPHAISHGVRISKWSEYIHDMKIQILTKGLFQRFIDTWTLLGNCIAFSKWIPYYDDKIIFKENDHYLLKNSKTMTLKELIDFNPREFEKKMYNSFKEKFLQSPIGSSPIMQANNNLKNYLILFIASSIARYRPLIWESILIGETSEQNQFNYEVIKSLVDLTRNNLLHNINNLIQIIRNNKFELFIRS